QKLKPHGMHTGYHNHLNEMVGEKGATPWDVIGKNTSPEVILQQDVGWTEAAGKNPVDFIKAYPGRTLTTHYKAVAPYVESSEHPIIGQDTTDWKSLIEANRTYGGTLWLVVEQEVYPEGLTPMQSIEASIKGLQKVIVDMDTKRQKLLWTELITKRRLNGAFFIFLFCVCSESAHGKILPIAALAFGKSPSSASIVNHENF